ncbi:MAG: hypothetical protein KF869_11850 [Phycisphaeraceae bacterium]|nr:hypothetical protein [Phycisphaeraceae bacterium]
MAAPRAMLNLAVSPYHLSTREPVAAIALTLCDHAVTALPEPAEGRSRAHIRAAVDRLPRLLRVLESWRWSGPLWRGGVLGSGMPHDRPFDGVGAAGREVWTDEAFARLAATVDPPPRVNEDDESARAAAPGVETDRWLDALCADMLRGGPDPRISTAVVAALDRYAASHGCIAVRGPTDSLAQRAESRLTDRVFALAIPVMSRAAGGKIVDLRAALRGPLEILREAMAGAFAAAGAPDTAALAAAAGRYTEAFESWFAAATRDDENDQRTMREFVSITGVRLPADSALVSARAAMRGVSRAAGRARDPRPAQKTDVIDRALPAMLIRPMNVRPA